MKQIHALTPGTRVRNADGIIGSVAQIEYRTTKAGKQPAKALVLSDDGRWRYSIPIKLIGDVTRNDNQDVAYLMIPTGELPRYILEEKTLGPDSVSPQAAAMNAQATVSNTNATLRIPLAAEELLVTTRAIQRGTLHLHKSVATEEQAFTVPTVQERVIVEHIPAAQFHEGDVSASDDIIIPVMEERLVVHKERVITEYIRIHKESITQQQEVHDTVRREILTISQEHRDQSETALPLIRMVDEKTRDTPTPS